MRRAIDSPALLVRSVAYGEADLIATFFTESAGKLSAIVRGGRRSSKRFGGALEPIHELVVSLEDKGKELCLLKEARIGRPRTGIASDLEAMDAAGQALRWVRHMCPPRTPEAAVWASLGALFDVLDDPLAQKRARALVAVFGLRLLSDLGYALELERCVGCGRPCPEGRPACIDAARGGLVCTSCGGARRTMSASLRSTALAALRGGPDIEISSGDAAEIASVVEDAMAAHAGFDAAKYG